MTFERTCEPNVHRSLVNDDINAIIARGESRTTELNSRYEGLNFEDLSNFKSEASVQQWEGEDFRSGVCCFTSLSSFERDTHASTAQKPHTQPLIIVQARTEVELFRGQLFQGCYARWAVQTRQSGQGAACTKADRDVCTTNQHVGGEGNLTI